MSLECERAGWGNAWDADEGSWSAPWRRVACKLTRPQVPKNSLAGISTCVGLRGASWFPLARRQTERLPARQALVAACPLLSALPALKLRIGFRCSHDAILRLAQRHMPFSFLPASFFHFKYLEIINFWPCVFFFLSHLKLINFLFLSFTDVT